MIHSYVYTASLLFQKLEPTSGKKYVMHTGFIDKKSQSKIHDYQGSNVPLAV